MSFFEKLGLAAGALIVAFCFGVLTGTHHEAQKWQAAVDAEAKREAAAIAQAWRAEAALKTATDQLDATADQLEKAREDALAKAPAPAACTDSADDVGSLRRLIQPR